MTGHTVILKLNQQQLELLDRTVAKGAAPDRASLVRLALREYAAKAEADAAKAGTATEAKAGDTSATAGAAA